MIKTPFVGYGERANELLALVYSDVCRLMMTQARGGYFYFITFIDNLSRFRYIFLMKYKSKVFDKFKEYQSLIEKQIEKNIKILRFDREGEYLSSEFFDHLTSKGILSEWIFSYTS